VFLVVGYLALFLVLALSTPFLLHIKKATHQMGIV